MNDDGLRTLRADDLSIVVQGRLDAADAARSARHCRHWRDTFPAAEIILSVSTSDVLAPAGTGPAALRAIAGRSHEPTAWLELADTVDQMVRAAPAEALAPLKFGGAFNNVNFQIAAAQAGLTTASRPYTLRVRSDLIVAGPLLDHYADCRAAAPAATMLSRRVMICHLFTLNPYAAERLPFHFSDWFQLGTTADLREMWTIAQYAPAAAAYYDTHPHARYSSPPERDFQSRYAAEQFVAWEFFGRRDHELMLDFHNDLLCRRQSLDILFGEFIIADPALCRIDFPKYRHVLAHPFSDLLCIGHADWRHFAEGRSQPDYRRYFRAKADRLGPFPGGYDQA